MYYDTKIHERRTSVLSLSKTSGWRPAVFVAAQSEKESTVRKMWTSTKTAKSLSAIILGLCTSAGQISDSSFMYPRPLRVETLAGARRRSSVLMKSTAEWLLLARKGLSGRTCRSFISEGLVGMCMYSPDWRGPSACTGRCPGLKHVRRPWLQFQNMKPTREKQSRESRATATSNRVTLPGSLWVSGDEWSPGPGVRPGAAVFCPWEESEVFRRSWTGVVLSRASEPEFSSSL